MKKLWYEKEAVNWEEALPIGNGRIGAMVFSGALNDKLQLNEDTLWSGYPNKCTKKHSMEEVYEIRKLTENKEYEKAYEKTKDTMFGVHSDSYVPYGNLYVDIVPENIRYFASEGQDNNDVIANYTRELDMTNGIAKASFTYNGINVEKEYFVSLKDDVLVIHIKSSEKLQFHIFEACQLEHSAKFCDNEIITEGRCPTEVSMYTNTVEYDEHKESIRFLSRVGINTNGGSFGGGNSLWVKSADDLTIIFSIKTSFNGYDKMPVSEGKEYKNASKEALKNAKSFTYDELKSRHIKEYQKYFDRTDLILCGEDYSKIPTDERIKRMGNGTIDNELVSLLFDFGKYLTISSSKEGTQPSNLQGIWNDKLIAPWHSNYTMNINTQMNYWPTETLNLPEFHMPLMVMLKEFSKKGNAFDLPGWSSWHNSDIWRFNYEATKEALWGYWQMGGFWSVRHIWEHYLHTNDKDFLEEYYPVMSGAAQFLEKWMYENKDGYLTTCPSTSPENRFLIGDKPCAVCEGSAMDMSIIYDLYDKLIKAGKVLGKDTSEYEKILGRLKPVKIGKDGRILEWGEELKESELGHRHISHLYGFFPSDIWADNDEYTAATKKTLETRLENGGGHTGWSNAWIANVYARLHDGESTMKHIRNMFKKSIYPNMFDAHPPFQIDGNFGIASAICEALLQSHKGKIEYLPALPKEWKSGEVKGFRTRTGETVSFKWNNGEITECNVKA